MQRKLRSFLFMRLPSTILSQLTSFMLGVAWAIVFTGVVSAFVSFVKINLIFGILSMILGAIPGLLMVLFLEHLLLQSRKLNEMQKQTELLGKIVENIAQS